ncbi:glycoside hydrolase family 2 TIM barrel-domain containing protein [Aquiflexum lacus]|uniref:glycoside hydrolase family 2 TIM barrel-domain containing protein n=1 Tax=Aquiflexum lacus TaxID=2483805 RepID=UPI001893DC0E|nr:glycoside hydrolase family 2 TIM barrel-domain containing protein [Aquiflexum lacus]
MLHYSKELKTTLFLISISLLFSCSKIGPENHNSTVAVRYQDGRAMLYRHGEPYFIKGAGGTEHLDKLAEYGGNSIRTWSLHDADSILDAAHQLGLTVTLGLEIGRPYWGNDFSYWKFWEVDQKIEELRPVIEKYKDHPALLMWGVGNEVKEYGGGKRVMVFYIIDKVAKMIKKVDSNHPTMTAVDGAIYKDRLALYKFIMPNIDILGFNAFNSIKRMSDNVNGKFGWRKAYIISEWGPSGHWEITDTEWGAPKELNMSRKQELMEINWNTIHQDSALLLGSYAFYWGFKHEATHTWFSLFSEDGAESSLAHFLKYAWSGKKADNLAPIVDNLFIETSHGLANDNVYLTANQEYIASASTKDPEGDSLTYRWEIRPEDTYFLNHQNFNYNMEHLILSDKGDKIQFITPIDEGPYRIFVFTFDPHGNVGSHNIPFYVVRR